MRSLVHGTTGPVWTQLNRASEDAKRESKPNALPSPLGAYYRDKLLCLVYDRTCVRRAAGRSVRTDHHLPNRQNAKAALDLAATGYMASDGRREQHLVAEAPQLLGWHQTSLWRCR